MVKTYMSSGSAQRFRKIMLFIVVLILLFSTPCVAIEKQKKEKDTMNLAQAIDHIRLNIVQIRDRSNIMVPLGVGFFVNSDGYVITAQHVVKARQTQILVGLAQPNTENMRGNFTLIDCEVVDEDSRHDLALLKLKKNPFKSEVRSGIVIAGQKDVPLLFGTAILDPTRPKDGVAVGISGYPLLETVLVTNAGWIASSWAFDVVEEPRLDFADIYLADIETNPGNSGGPVYLIENAAVIGVCVAVKTAPVRDQEGKGVNKLYYSSGLTKVIPARYVVELLKKHNLNWSGSKSTN